MGKGSSVSSTPDPQVGKAAIMQAQTGQEMLDFYKSAYADSEERQKVTDALGNQVTEQQLANMQTSAGWAQEDRDRYTSTFVPMQDQYIETAQNWDSPERQAALAAEAKADVQSNAALAKQANDRSMAAMGVNPNSGRFQGADRAASLTTGLAIAGAQNNARSQSRTQGLALQESAINLGNGLAANASSNTSLANASGASALGTNLSANGQMMSATGLMGQGYSGAMQGYAGQAGTLSSIYGTQVNAAASQSAGNAAGIGTAVGGIATAAVLM